VIVSWPIAGSQYGARTTDVHPAGKKTKQFMYGMRALGALNDGAPAEAERRSIYSVADIDRLRGLTPHKLTLGP
jgi:hypothetical protein